MSSISNPMARNGLRRRNSNSARRFPWWTLLWYLLFGILCTSIAIRPAELRGSLDMGGDASDETAGENDAAAAKVKSEWTPERLAKAQEEFLKYKKISQENMRKHFRDLPTHFDNPGVKLFNWDAASVENAIKESHETLRKSLGLDMSHALPELPQFKALPKSLPNSIRNLSLICL